MPDTTLTPPTDTDSAPHNLIGRVSHYFVVNRPLSLLLFMAAVLAGFGAYALTPKQYNPEIVRPAFAVSLAYRGATVDEALDRVVYELVEKVSTVPGVDDIYTEVRDGAQVVTTVIFEVGYDATKAKLDLQTELMEHRYLARGFIEPPMVMEIDPETIPVFQAVFVSETHSIGELRELVTRLAHTVRTVPEVSVVSVAGGYAPALVVEADPGLLAAHDLTLDELSQVLAGSMVRSVSEAQDTRYRTDVAFSGRMETAEELGLWSIRPDLLVRDVARIYEGPTTPRSYLLNTSESEDGTIASGEAVMLAVSKVEGASAPGVTDAVRGKLDMLLQEEQYAGLTYRSVADDGQVARAEIAGLTKNLLTSIAIVALVLLLFLSVRAASVVLVAIPLTLLIVFGLGYLFDQTINRITLFALILSLGLLVDSAIVVVENIYAHLSEWRVSKSERGREEVVARAVSEIGVGLLLSTATSVIVFLPMRYITGMMGPYMGPIAFFVPVALMVSLVVAVVVTPFVAAHVLKTDERVLPPTRVVATQMAALTQRYQALLRAVLYNRRTQRLLLGGALLGLVLSLVLPAVGLVHFQMLPRADRDQLYLYIDAPIDSDTEHTRNLAETVAALAQKDPAVQSTQAFVATAPIIDFNGMFKGAQNRTAAHQASIRVNLTPADTRRESSTDVAQAFRERVRAEVPELAPYVRVMEEPPGPPVRATLVARVSAGSYETQRAVAGQLYAVLAQVDGVVDRFQSDEVPVARARYEYDPVQGGALGVSAAAVRDTLAFGSGSREVGEFASGASAEYMPLVLGVTPAYRTSPTELALLPVRTAEGTTVPLGTVARAAYEARPSVQYLENGTALSYVTGEVEERSIVYVVLELMWKLAHGALPGIEVSDWNLFGMTLHDEASGEEVLLTWGGEWEMTLENFRDLGLAMGVALLLVYGLLVAQYRRFATPAFILVTVPLGLIGILWGFLLLDQGFGVYLTATALIGFIALIGIVVNNAIIFLEYVEQALVRGLDYREALIEAGGARLRPIFLTSLTTVLGSLTIASDPVWSGLAWAIVFGLSLSTLLTLVVYPTLLVYFGKENAEGPISITS